MAMVKEIIEINQLAEEENSICSNIGKIFSELFWMFCTAVKYMLGFGRILLEILLRLV